MTTGESCVNRKKAVMTWRTIPVPTTVTKGNHENGTTAGVLPVKFQRLELKFRAILLQPTGNFNSWEAAIPNNKAGKNTTYGLLDILRLS
jgi:hypothetical protein